jgi:hypothetical protein
MTAKKLRRPVVTGGAQEVKSATDRVIPQVDTAPQAAALLRYGNIKKLAKDLNRPASTLIALSPNNDPFSITPTRHDDAHWFARIYKRLDMGSGNHLRRLHYTMISQSKPLKMSNGMPYENTDDCWQALIRASNDARYLNLVAAEDFVDRRNAEPLINVSNESAAGFLHTIFDEPYIEAMSMKKMPNLPRLVLSPPKILQPCHVELWCEKTTVNDVLEQVADDYGCNVITGAGELSQTACVNLVERSEDSGRPVRILYISDFDPAGQSMPVAVARKIEHRLYLKELDLDIQVRPIALTSDQCERYRLPRTPIKATERRAGAFEHRFGEGATELDALEALRPGELGRIIEHEIERYFDSDLNERIRAKAAEINNSISTITRKVEARHKPKIKVLESDWTRMAQEHAREQANWQKRAKPIWQAIADDLRKRAPASEEIEWPEPNEADEDEDPLFDSTRAYVEQIDRYKAFQNKPTARRNRNSDGG